MVKAIFALIAALPEVLKLIKHIQEEHKKSQLEKKVKDDLKAINRAFETQDANLLNRVFSGMPDGREAHKD